MSPANQLREQGRKAGILAGMQQEKSPLANAILSEGLDYSLISNLTGLSQVDFKK